MQPAAGMGVQWAPPAAPFDTPLHKLGFVLVNVYLFIFLSRLVELTLEGLKIPLIIYLVMMMALGLSGGAFRFLSMRIGVLTAVFSFWLLCTVPFAFWKVGSIQTSISMFQTLGLVAAMVGFLRTPRQVTKCLYALAASSLLAAILSRFFGANPGGRTALARGTLSDPNDYAMVLLLGLPFWWLAARNCEGSPFRKILALAATVPIILVILMTGSRGGAAGLLTMLVLVFLGAPLRTKILIPIGAVLMLLFTGVVLSDYLKARYLTFFNVSDVENLDAYSREQLTGGAVRSSESRLAALRYSLNMTARHPLFGVGPGNFPNVMFDEMTRAGGGRVWMVTHNTYTQISSETGIPGIALFAGILFYSFASLRALLKRDRDGRHLYPAEVVNAASYLRISLVALSLCGCFLSFAYFANLYVLAALAGALRLSAAGMAGSAA